MAFVLPPANLASSSSNASDHAISARASSRAAGDDASVPKKPGEAVDAPSKIPLEGTTADSMTEKLNSAATPGLQSNVNEENENHSHDESQSVRGSDSHEISYPEGGLRAWNIVGSFHSYIGEHQLREYDEGTIDWIFNVFIFLSFFGGIQIGPVFDSRGPRMLMLAGSVYMELACCFSDHVLITPVLAAVSHFFLEKRETATGIATAGGSLGGIMFPLVLQKHISQDWVCLGYQDHRVRCHLLLRSLSDPGSLSITSEARTNGYTQPKHLPRPVVLVAYVGDIFHGMGAFRSNNLSYFLWPVHRRHVTGNISS
ncbi:hypothetical protein ACJ73_02374 [Blastomyces percursus]|uniref:Major facilitator superfamily (MFS) profile domain-containing protein n=1 Tax=Blastomyces percursus TaxID=1658174 RepID=A0A1J9RCK6_9EURO|nr:hypothetical protein ACJ73_02374 [Blastomyces percursus]